MFFFYMIWLFSQGNIWGARVVLFQSKGQEISKWGPAKQGGYFRLLEGDWDRQTGADSRWNAESWSEKGFGFLRRKTTKRDQD